MTSLPATRAYEAWVQSYRRTWRGSVAASFLNPVLYLTAMGLGLGSYVKSSQLPGVDYVTYIAPGLLAATAMQIAVGESTWPVLGSIKWWKRYHAMLATPLRVVDVMVGHLWWMFTRVALVTGVYLAVMAGFGTVPRPSSVLAWPAAILTGMAFATPIAAIAARLENDTGFTMLFRFGVVPLFLFSGTFFPISQLPGPLQPVAWITPLWHGVDLCRALDLGIATAGMTAIHVTYLGVLTLLGSVLAHRSYSRRLRV